MPNPVTMPQTSEEEEWRACPGHPSYEVSNLGRVRSIDRIRPHNTAKTQFCRGMIRKLYRNRGGYPTVSMDKTNPLVHRLVLEAFVGPCPEGMECAHLDGDRWNARLDNLRWATSEANNSDKHQHRTLMHGEYVTTAKLNWEKVREIRRIGNVSDRNSRRDLARLYGVTDSAIYMILRGKRWPHDPLIIGADLGENIPAQRFQS